MLESLNHYASNTTALTLQKTFINQEQAKLYLANYPVDLIFLHIEGAVDNEMDFYKRLSIKPQLIFISRFGRFAADAFDIGATDYLLTPFSFERFLQAASKARHYCPMHAQMHASSSSACLFVRSGSRLVGISFGDIEYIRGCDDYIKIFFNQKKPVLSHISLNDILERLPTDQFIRIHRSFIIPVSKITQYRRGQVFLGELRIPIGATYLPVMRKILGFMSRTHG